MKKSTNTVIIGFIIDNFRSKLIESFSRAGDNQYPQTPFTHINSIKSFFQSIFKDEITDNISEKVDMISSSLSTLTFILIKFNDYMKTLKNEDKINEPANSSILFNPANAQLLLNYGTKALGLNKKIKENIDALAHQINAMDKSHPNLISLQVKQNQSLMIKDSLSRVKELVKELKSYI